MRPAPAWVATLPVGQWKTINMNKIVDVDSAKALGYPTGAPWSSCEGISGIIDDWTGGALASNYGKAGALLVFGGGHCGYGGSDVYGFDLADQVWKRISNPYVKISGVVDDTGTFPDGSPIPTHTYDLAEYQPTTNSFVVLTAYNSVPGTTHVPVAHLLNLDHLTADKYMPSMWKRSPANRGGPTLEGGGSCYDRNRDVFWIWEVPTTFDRTTGGFTNRFTQYNPKGVNPDGTVGSYANYKGDGSGFGGGPGADCDPKKDIFVFNQFNGGDNTKVYYRDLRNPAALGKRLTVASGGPPVSQANGWEYSDTRDSFLFWKSGADVWELKITDSMTREFSAAAWKKISQGGLAPEANFNGTFSRFRIAKFALNGGLVEVAVVVSYVGEKKDGSDGHVYAFRIPGAP